MSGSAKALHETVGDLTTPGRSIIYPLSDEQKLKLKYMYDFHIKKPGSRWVYVDSCNSIREWGKQKDMALQTGGQWRIVEAATCKVVDHS